MAQPFFFALRRAFDAEPECCKFVFSSVTDQIERRRTMADNKNADTRPATGSDRNESGQFSGGDAARDAGHKGGEASSGSFQQGSERASEAGQKGGQASSGSFEQGSDRASEAGRKGGEASSGSFEKGSERASEAGRKGGSR